jgi:hypothetical protein
MESSSALIVLEIIITPIVLRVRIPHMENLQRSVVGVATAHLEPGQLPLAFGGGGQVSLRPDGPRAEIRTGEIHSRRRDGRRRAALAGRTVRRSELGQERPGGRAGGALPRRHLLAVESRGGTWGLEAVPAIRRYIKSVPVARPYWEVEADSSDEALSAASEHHPVFRLTPLPEKPG